MNSRNTLSKGNIEITDVPMEKVTVISRIIFIRKDIQKLIMHHLLAEFAAIIADSYCFITT
jgi:hypothetical protein